jgi:hypothetical protein
VHGNNSLSGSKRTKVTEDSVEICQLSIEPVQVCTEEIRVEFGRNRFVEHSMRKISTRSASSRRMPGGKKVSLVEGIL